MIKQKLMFIAALLLFGADVGRAQVSLEIDGHTVVPAGQLTDIRYNYDLRTLVVTSVHADWRCVANVSPTPVVSAGDFRLVFDSVNPATETDAIYRIAAEGLGGSITQDLLGGKIIIQTSAVPSERLICAPFRESFFSSDFGDLLELDDNAPAIAASGSDLTVPFTVTNRSESLVATGIRVWFQSEYDPVTTEILGPSFNPIDGAMSILEPDVWEIDILYPGESASIEIDYDVGAATPDGTMIRTNIDQVTAMNRAGDAPLGTDNLTLTTTVPVGEADIGLLKTGMLNDDDGTPGVSAGDTISYTFEVTNNSQVTLTGIELSDPQADVSGGPIATLAPGATDTDTFSAVYTLTQSDVDEGSFTNLATVTSAEGASAIDVDTRSFSGSPAMSLTKIGVLNDDDATTGLSAGDSISYVFSIENTGTVTLTNISVSDAGATVSGGPIASLQPGQIDDTTISGSYVVTQPDIDAGLYENTASANSAEGVNANDIHEQMLSGSPAMVLTKTGVLNDDDSIPGLSVGDTISYSFAVENVGNVTLTDISVGDLGATLTGGPIASLAPGASNSSIGGSYTVTQSDIDAGSYSNTALASSAEGATAGDTSNVVLAGNPSLSLFVDSQWTDDDNSGGLSVGDLITYDFDLFNDGNVTLTNVNVTVSVANADVTISGGPIAALAPGDVDGFPDPSTITGVYTITQDDINAGSYTLLATGRSTQADSSSVQEVTNLP